MKLFRPVSPLVLLSALSLSLTLLPSAAPAAEIGCPDLAQAVQAGTCPSEDELRFTYNGYCSDNKRAYEKTGVETCVDYQAYRIMKNVALWESGDGEFQAYLSCELSPERIRQAKASGIAVDWDRKITRLSCDYGEGVRFTHRSRASCHIENAAACASDPAACRASCE